MRTMTMIAAAAMLAVAPAAYAQTETPPVTPETAQPQTQAPVIKEVTVVELTELPEAEQTRVTAATAQSTEADLESLRSTIDANATASAALQAEGIGSEAVIAALMSPDGTLMLVTKRS